MGGIIEWVCGTSEAEVVEVPGYVYGEGRGLLEESRGSLSKRPRESIDIKDYDRDTIGRW